MSISLNEAWIKNMYKTVDELHIKSTLTRQELKRGALSLVKGLNASKRGWGVTTSDSEAEYINTVWSDFEIYGLALKVIGMLTPNEFLNIFPTKKGYDGHKFEMKDYFSVQEAIEDWNLSQPIGDSEQVFDFLWDLYNLDINFFMVGVMSSMSSVHSMQTGKGLIEDFFGIEPVN